MFTFTFNQNNVSPLATRFSFILNNDIVIDTSIASSKSTQHHSHYQVFWHYQLVKQDGFHSQEIQHCEAVNRICFYLTAWHRYQKTNKVFLYLQPLQHHYKKQRNLLSFSIAAAPCFKPIKFRINFRIF